MRLPFVSVLIATMFVSACSGSSGLAPRSSLTGSQSSFSLTPNEINLTPDMPWDTVYAQDATVGVNYTPYAPAACMRSIGSIVVVGEGVAHVDVAGSPLQFVVAAVGATPPPSCLIVVVGSDGSAAVVQVTYSNDPVTDMPDDVHRLSVTHFMSGASPKALGFTNLDARAAAATAAMQWI